VTGSALWAARIPTSAGVKPGHAGRVRQHRRDHASGRARGKLLDLVRDDITRRKIGDMIAGTKRRAAPER